jgi:hypothetical protein
MARPNLKPIWATGGAIVEPSAGQKATGWQPGTKPPAQHANWLANYTYQWIEHFDVPLVTSMLLGVPDPGATGWQVGTPGTVIATTTSGARWICPIPMRVGDSLSSATFWVQPNGASATITCDVWIYSGVTLVASSGGTVSTTGTAWEEVFVDDPTSGYVLGPNDVALAIVEASGAGANIRRAGHLNWITA